MKRCPAIFGRSAMVTYVSHSKDSEIKEAIKRIAKTNTILKCPVNNLFTVENKYNTNEIDKASHREMASPFPCFPVNWSMVGEERPNALSLAVFIEIYSLIMTK